MAADLSKIRRSTLGDPPAEASGNLTQPETANQNAPEAPRMALMVERPYPTRAPTPPHQPLYDGRTARRTFRTVQLATRVTPSFDNRLRIIAHQRHLLIVEVLELALDALEKSLG